MGSTVDKVTDFRSLSPRNFLDSPLRGTRLQFGAECSALRDGVIVQSFVSSGLCLVMNMCLVFCVWS